MAVTRVQRVSNTSSGTTVNLNIASPSVNNIIVAVVGCNGTVANMSMSGAGWDVFTESAYDNSTAANSIGIYARVVVSTSETSYTASCSGANNMFLHVFEFSGVGTLAQSIPAENYASSGSGTGVTSYTTQSSVAPKAGVSGYAVTGIWWQGGAVTNVSVSNSFTNLSTFPATIRGATAELSIANTTGLTVNTQYSWTTSRPAAAAMMVVTENNTNVYVVASESTTVFDTPEIRRDPLIMPTISDTVTLTDKIWYYDDLIYVGDRVVILIAGTTDTHQFFAWFG